MCDLERVLGYTQTKVSRHLAYLRRTGLVVQRREGLWKLYALAPARSEDHARILKALRAVVRTHATADDDLKKLAGQIGRVCCSRTGEVSQHISPALLRNRSHRRRTVWMRTP